jgi:hypothetical protein
MIKRHSGLKVNLPPMDANSFVVEGKHANSGKSLTFGLLLISTP